MKKIQYNLKNANVTLYEGFFKKKESNQLFNNLQSNVSWKQEQIKMFGKEINIPRLTEVYGNQGLSYKYSGIQTNAIGWVNPDVDFIRKQILKELNLKFNFCLLNQYRGGNDSVSWHQDNEPALGQNPIIASVSFGSERNFQLRNIDDKKQKVNIVLPHGSLLLMQGGTQHFWEHQIPKTKKQVGSRINLTFRIL